jgi:membrane-associated phospholipid phosphatase
MNFLNFQGYKHLKGMIVGDLVIQSWLRYDIKGGCFPSPHCAAGFTILYYLHKNRLKIFYPILVIMVGMFVSTVYGRFHYLTDSITGILLSLFINITISKLQKHKYSMHY